MSLEQKFLEKIKMNNDFAKVMFCLSTAATALKELYQVESYEDQYKAVPFFLLFGILIFWDGACSALLSKLILHNCQKDQVLKKAKKDYFQTTGAKENQANLVQESSIPWREEQTVFMNIFRSNEHKHEENGMKVGTEEEEKEITRKACDEIFVA
uniref:Uncharacterized protein n=1 Tax=Romanomermis culicivorax TaxID=13658 RepID=A0A915IKX4_ROMCU